jgi:hypothetical protein
VQFATRREEQVGGAGQILERCLERGVDLRPIDHQRPADGVVVAQTAAPILQVGFQQRRHVAEASPAVACGDLQPLQPTERLLAPLLDGRLADIAHHRRVAGQAADAEQRGGSVQVVGSELTRRLRRVHRRAELQPGIPHRVPETLRDGLHVWRGGALRVQQHDVDVAARAQHAAGVPTRGSESPAGGQLAGQALEPGIHLL